MVEIWFLGFVCILLFNLKKVEKEKIQYYADTLRAMAFPGRQSGSNGNYCNVTFTMSSETTKLLQSVLIRYSWNILSHHNAFEFNGILKNSEPLTSNTKQTAPEPLFFVYENDMVIVYAGLSDQEEAGNENLLQSTIQKVEEYGNISKNRTM
jgi:hypothetical protein